MKKILSLLLALLLLPGAMALAEDGAAVYVDGVAIPESLVESYLSMTKYANSSLSEEEQTDKAAKARELVLEELVAEQVCLNDANKKGITPEGEVLADADERYNKMIASVENYIKQTYPNLTDEELAAQVDAMLAATGASREIYRMIAERAAILDAYWALCLADMPDPEEAAVRERYDSILAEQKKEFAADENRFESAMLNGELVLHRPVDLKMIQKVEFLFDSEAMALIRSTRMYNEEAADEMAEDQYARLTERVEGIYRDLQDGKISFAEVMENEKPGSSAKINYFHPTSTRFSKDYYDRANAFSKPGELSTIYRIQNGFAILYYVGLLPACEAVPLEQVRDEITAQLRAEAADAYLTQIKTELRSKATVVYPEATKP